MRQSVLVIGANGQLGRALAAEFRQALGRGRGQAHEVAEAAHRDLRPGQATADLADPKRLNLLLEKLKPHWVLIAGAFCNVDLCETERDACTRVNVEGPAAVADWAAQKGGVVAFYSTDHVFDGSRPVCSESDPRRPLNVYAGAKVKGEDAIRRILPDSHLILRTSWLYGPDAARKNFVLRLVDQLRAGETVRVPSDQWGSPTYTEDLARATRFLLERSHRGTVHATGPDFLTRSDLALQICGFFKLSPSRIVPTPTRELDQPARRPLRIRLSTERLTSTGAPGFRSVAQGLAALSLRLC